MMLPACFTITVPLIVGLSLGQAGDHAGEEQPALPESLVVPPAPALRASEERETFRLAADLEIELVACEPLVSDPVAASFDEEGRLWVAEMRGYMPDVDGAGESAPVGTIVVLADTDGDGRLDQRRVFLEELVMPRALAPTRGGLLCILPPQLLFCWDSDGDGRADRRELIEDGLGGIESPEHAVNGLMYGLDNWFHCANWSTRYRYEREAWQRGPTAGGGQWGITQDDLGRIFYNTNPDPLRGDLYSSHYAIRNPNLGRASGVNLRFAEDTRVWPGRVTPGVNRGYQEGILKAGKLTRFTAACAPFIQRGDGLPAEFHGDAFVCEPAGNLIKRFRLEDDGAGGLVARNAYEGREFLTSTDERFRPVHLFGGPDGALYVLDMYRGVIQHRLFVTSFLRRQIVERGLEQPIGLGRIWRIRTKGRARGRQPEITSGTSELSWTELVELLAHPNGWWRDTAQRVIVEEGRGSRDARELLSETVLESESALARLHALWSLEGIGALDAQLLTRALEDQDARVLEAAVRLSEGQLGRGKGRFVERLLELSRTGDARLCLQVALSLGEGAAADVDPALASILTRDASRRELRSAVASGIAGREAQFMRRLATAPEWREPAPGRAQLLRLLARCVGREGRSDSIALLLETMLELPESAAWQRTPLAQGLLEARPKGPDGEPTYLELPNAPESFEQLVALGESAQPVRELASWLAWPGRAGLSRIAVRALDEEERSRFERGRTLYASACVSCHQSSGLGEPGKAPALRHSACVLGDPERLVRVVGWGLTGRIEVHGEVWNQQMPAYDPGDEELAALLTYLRREWGHGADPLEASAVAGVRARVGVRQLPFTAAELNGSSAGQTSSDR